MKFTVFLLLGLFLLPGEIKFETPARGEVWYLESGPYEVRWSFKGFSRPSTVKLDFFLGNNCKIASGVELTHGMFFWIPRKGLCGGLHEGKYFLRAVWKDGEARSEYFLLKELPVAHISLEPDLTEYRAGDAVVLSWPEVGEGKGELSLWRGEEMVCSLGEVPLGKTSFSWKVPAGCGGKGLLGKFLNIRLLAGCREVARSHVFKVVGEMPPVRRRFR